MRTYICTYMFIPQEALMMSMLDVKKNEEVSKDLLYHRYIHSDDH